MKTYKVYIRDKFVCDTIYVEAEAMINVPSAIKARYPNCDVIDISVFKTGEEPKVEGEAKSG